MIHEVAAQTYTATIYVGLREGYDGPVHDIEDARKIVQRYCDKVGLAVTVTPTTFVYTYKSEPGVAIGLINYPRFRKSNKVILGHARAIAMELMIAMKQFRTSIVTPDNTIMLEDSSV